MKVLTISILEKLKFFTIRIFATNSTIYQYLFFKVPSFLVQNFDCIESIYSNVKILYDAMN